jgi:hypothetical protein
MKKWTSVIFTLLVLETIGNGVGDFMVKAADAVIPHKSDKVTSNRAASWVQHDMDYREGTDPSGMSASG